MPNLPASVATASLSILLLAATLPAQTTDQANESTPTSKIRIVRLSEVKGVVQLDRNIGRGFEPAIANMPIVELSRLKTGVGVAEVEFEDNSTLRLAPDSAVEFPQLARLATGSTASSVHLLSGTAYVSLVKSKGNEFNITFGERQIQLPPATHIRLQLLGTEANLAVLDGSLRVAGPSGVLDVPHKKTVTFSLLHETDPTLAKDIAPEAFDTWDKNAAGYHARTASMSAFGNSPYSYGLNDMMYYGSFANSGGCGSMWRPYFASAGWDPYSNGAMAYYSGAGYSWVSPYPWGWTPYHSGNWSYCNGTGWGWQPGGGWNGLNNIAAVTSPGGTSSPGGPFRRLPISPTLPPKGGQPTIVAVNSRPIVRSEVGSSDSFVFRKDSAGMGIPRDTLGKLNGLSQRAISHGTATTQIYLSGPSSASANSRPVGNSTYVAPTSIHRGSPPQSSGNTASYGGSSGSISNGGGMRSGGSAPSASPAPAPSASRNH
jgi:hypothetical protein